MVTYFDEFQSTLPRGERQLFEVANAAVKSISIHAPTRGATFANAIKLDKLLFQSTLPRGERHSVCINFFCALKISIHAPTRGATRCSYKLTNMSLISIHAPTRGATMTSTGYVRRMCNFNPRSHEGSDGCSDIADQVDYISIHAPTRGATALIAIGVALYKFQSTLPRGERHFVLLITHTFIYISIHAPTRGATHVVGIPFKAVWDFNPRSHEGSDLKWLITMLKDWLISIHAPTRGATKGYRNRK